MHETIKKMVDAFERQREKRRRACAVFTALAILVSLTTTYMLVMPANTQEIEYACGLEAHEHSKEDGCYVLVCGYDEDERGTGTSGGAGFDQLFGQEEPVEEIDPAEEETENVPEQDDVLDENGEEVSEEDATPSEDAANDEPVVNEPAAEEPVQQNPVTEIPVQEEPAAEKEETQQPVSEPVVESEPVQQDAPAMVSEPAETTSDGAVTETAASQILVATMTHYDNGPEASESASESADTPAAPSEPVADSAPSEEPAESSSETTDAPSEPAEEVVEEEIIQEEASEVEETETEVDEDEVTQDEAVEDEIVEDEIVEDEVTEDGQENSSGNNEGKHVHTRACYELICELPEHEHDEECIKEEELELICVIPEHTHGAECYAEAELICVEEAEDHEHGEGCYAEAALICDLEEHTHGDACYAVKQGSLLIILPEGAEIPEGYDVEYTYIDPDNRYGVAVYAQPGTFPDGAQLAAELMEEGSDAYEETSAVLEELVDRGEASYDEFVALDVHFLLDGEEVQPVYPVYVCMNVVGLFSDKIDPTSISVRHFAENHDEVVEDPAEEIIIEESTVPLTEAPADVEDEDPVAQTTEAIETAPAPVVVGDLLVETVADSSEETGLVEGIKDQDNVVETVVAAFDMSGFSTVLFTGKRGLQFTVQHYAWVTEVDYTQTTGTLLSVIDTDGQKMPANGDTNTVVKNIALDSNGEVITKEVLQPIYTESTYMYSEKISSGNGDDGDNLRNINKLYDNSNYTLTEVWVLKGLKEDGSEWWEKYDPATVDFTNSTPTDEKPVKIENGTVIRLVYDETGDSDFTAGATFHDYYITSGSYSAVSNWPNARLYNTNKQGINNYSGDGAKLAFGNKNTQTGLQDEIWEDKNGIKNTLNQYNSTGYKGCTFGLAAGMNISADGDKTVQFANGVSAPNIFGDRTSATTKRSAAISSDLGFARNGDAYTLTSVSGNNVSASNLQQFELLHPYNQDPVYSNQFWPMDNIAGRDPKFGAGDHYYYTAIKQYGANQAPLYAVAISQWGTPSMTFPIADDWSNHNNYFGMEYSVSFDLTADYIGPLDYLFFGDDDMWVFLTNPDGSHTLVCDIGGVHSSVGQYVNLWDYIPRDSRTEDGTYALNFFYTERGASGSSCYMRFTLPSVSGDPISLTTGDLSISKEVVGVTNDAAPDFEFRVVLEKDGEELTDGFAFATTNAVDLEDEKTMISSGDKIHLSGGDEVIISGLPVGTTYTITETAVDGYFATYKINSGTITAGQTATGTVSVGTTSVAYINNTGPMLPSTGGIGTNIYTTVGIVMMLGAGVLLLNQWRRKEVAFCRKKR